MSMGIQKIGHQNLSCRKGSYSSTVEVKDNEDNPVLAADSGNDSDDCELTELSCELGTVEGRLCCIPYELYDLPDLRDILSLDTWNLCLTEEERFYLADYLPDMDQQTFCLTMKELFDGSDMYFGNPLDTFFKRLKGGFYPPKVTYFREGLQFLQRKKYYHSLRSYHDRMAQMFVDMRRIWDQCEMSSGVEERISMWTKRRKQRGINLLDLNKVPKDDHLLGEEVHLDTKGMKLVESNSVAKDIWPFLCAKRMKLAAPNCRPKGVLKMKASANISFQNHNPKIAASNISEHVRSVPKGVLKIVPKVPSARLEQSDIVPKGLQPTFLVRSQGLQDYKFSSMPSSLHFQDAGSLHDSPFLRQKIDGSRVHLTQDQPQCLLNQQESVIETSNHSESSTRKIKREIIPSLDDISVLGKHKLFGGDVGRGPCKEYNSSLDPMGARRYTFGGENLRGTGTEDFSLRSLESYPFHIQYHGQEQHMAPLKEEHVPVYPRIPEAGPRISDFGNCKQETLMESSSDQMKGENDVVIRKSEKLLSKSSVSEGFKNETVPPLTYKRRKALAKVNPLDFSKSLTAGADLKSAIPKESNQHLGEGAKALKIKLMGGKICP